MLKPGRKNTDFASGARVIEGGISISVIFNPDIKSRQAMKFKTKIKCRIEFSGIDSARLHVENLQ